MCENTFLHLIFLGKYIHISHKCVFTGHANHVRRMRMLKKWQSPTVVLYAAKARQTCAEVFFLNFLRKFPAPRVVFYSQFVLKHVLKASSYAQDLLKTCAMFAKSSQIPKSDHDSLPNVSRKQRSSPDYFSRDS